MVRLGRLFMVQECTLELVLKSLCSVFAKLVPRCGAASAQKECLFPVHKRHPME